MIFDRKFKLQDGRWFILATLLLYFSVLIFSEIFLGSYEKTWKFLGVFAIRSFIDLKVLLCGIEEYLQGANPYLWIKCTYNYPLLWVIFSYIPYFHSAYLNQIGIFLGVLFFAGLFSYIKKINVKDSLIYCFLFVSPPVMLAVERGNCDVIIFLLILVSLFFLAKKNLKSSYAFLLFSTFLKFYPIFGFLYLLETIKSKKILIYTCVGVAVIFGLYLFAIKEQLKPIYAIHPRKHILSYGIYTLPALINSKYTSLSLDVLKIITFIIALITIVYCFVFYRYNDSQKEIIKAAPVYFNGYLIGSSIFVGSFLMGNNYDYRLIFLLFTIPQLLLWFKLPHKRREMAVHLFVLVYFLWGHFTISVSFFLFHTKFIANLTEEIASWILYFLHIDFLIFYIFKTWNSPEKRQIAGLFKY